MRRAREGSFGATAGNSTGARDDSPNSNNSGSLTPSRSRSEQVASVEDRLIGLGFLGPRDVDTRREGSGNGREAPRGQGRRSRVEDLEEMMLMEAIRLSLLEEEKERRKREEEEAKKQPGSSSSTTQASTSASGTGTPLGVVEVESSAEGKGKKPERPAIESKGESSESMENNENEPMFNFTRLSAMLEAEGRDGKDGERLEHVENAAAHGEERRGA